MTLLSSIEGLHEDQRAEHVHIMGWLTSTKFCLQDLQKAWGPNSCRAVFVIGTVGVLLSGCRLGASEASELAGQEFGAVCKDLCTQLHIRS